MRPNKSTFAPKGAKKAPSAGAFWLNTATLTTVSVRRELACVWQRMPVVELLRALTLY